jgi:hypothetical protein
VGVVTVIAYIAGFRRASWLVGLLVAYDVIEILVFNGLSQREHLVGVTVGALLAGAVRLGSRRSATPGRGRTEPTMSRPAGGEYDTSAEPVASI